METDHQRGSVWMLYDSHDAHRLMPLKVLENVLEVRALSWFEDYFLLKYYD